MKKIIFTLVLMLIPSIILANEISNIDIDIYVDNEGVAHVTEKWDTSLYEGTEGYKPYYNLGESSIENFKVSLNGTKYTFSDYYNIYAPFEEKAYVNGFHYIDNGIELCFGISKYGDNTYILTYDITNFVVNTSDGYQMIYWTLFPYDYNPSPSRVYIKIHSDFAYSDTLDVWGFGKYGAPTYVYDGYIEMDSEDTVRSSEYMTLLVKFPENTFTSSVVMNKTFDDYLSMAKNDSKAYKQKNTSNIINTMITLIFGAFPFLLVLLIFIIAIVTNNNNKYGYIGNKKILKTVPLFREIPCNKDIYYANTLAKLNRTTFSGYKDTNIFGAIILKWVRNGKILFHSEEGGIFNKYTSTIDLTLNPTFDNLLEKELFDMMHKASKDGILQAKELEKYCEKNYTKFFNLFERINKVEIEKLKASGHIRNRLNKEECKYKNVMDDSIYEESTRLYGLKKFLEEFSQIGSKEVLEVHLWDEYLMFAYIFGMADKVAKQLKNLYPEVLTGEDIDFGTLMYIHDISYSSVSAASTARTRAGSYSSGGGGFSSGGGGGGSFGGGGGGGGFR